MKRCLVVCALLAAAVALAEPASDEASSDQASAETWIPLEDLPVDDQNAALDAQEGDVDKRAASSAWSAATDQLVIHAIWTKAIAEVGADLLVGTP